MADITELKIAPWKRTATGYETIVNGKKATLAKSGKSWRLTVGGKSYDLGKKAGFGHAEGLLKKLASGRSHPEAPVMTGKKGGKYIVTKSGAKHYV